MLSKKEERIANRIIMGIDPGTNLMGYGLLEANELDAKVIISGVIDLKKLDNTYLKYQQIFSKTLTLIDTYKPDELAIESQFYGKNIQSMLKLGRAQGIAIAAALQRDIPIFEYAPRKIKLAVTGRGAASKEQISSMVNNILKLKETKRSFDETDALAIALCHFFQKDLKISSDKVVSWKNYIKKNPDKIRS